MRILAMAAAAALLIGTVAVQAQENDKRANGTEGSTAVENGSGAGGHKAMAHKKMAKHHKSSKTSSKM